MVEFFIELLGDGGGVFGLTLILGLVFGLLGERSGFCLRAAVEEWAKKGLPTEVKRKCSRTTQYVTAVAVAVVSVQCLLHYEVVDLSETVHRTASFTWLGMALGGILFGIGMVLAGGCVSRLTILAARGNLRSWWTLIILALAAWATIGGLLSPIRLFLEGAASTGEPSPYISGERPTTLIVVAVVSVVAISMVYRMTKACLKDLTYGSLIGLLVPAGWIITNVLAADPFDPAPVVSMSFTRPMIDSLQLITISSGLTWNFGMGLVLGTLVGAFTSALMSGRLYLEGFVNEADPIRYGLGGLLMGFGGIIGLGCSMGQGLTGLSTLSSGSLLVFVCIIAGSFVTFRLRR